MKKTLSPQWTMILRTQEFLKSKPAITSTIVGAADVLTELSAITEPLAQLLQRHEERTSGYTFDKNRLKSQLEGSTIKVLTKLVAFSARTSNETLNKEMKQLMRRIEGSSGPNLIHRSRRAASVIEENLAGLADWAITAATVTALKGQIEDFETVLTLPRQKINERSGIGLQIAAYIKEAMKKLSVLDDLVGAMADIEPEFAAMYKKNRSLINAPKNRLAALCVVKDAATGLPIQNADVTTPFGSFITSKTGQLRIKAAAPGSYIIGIRRPGSVSSSFTLDIVQGITTKETFSLQAS